MERMKSATESKSRPTLKLLVGSWHLLKQNMAFGNPTAGGFTTMAEALRAVEEMNVELRKYHQTEFAVSGHWYHEIMVPSWCNGEELPDPLCSKWNNPRAVNLQDWKGGVRKGFYPRIGRIIPPGFGLPGSDNGALINPDRTRRDLAIRMMRHSMEISEEIIREGLGEGHVIYWTGPDGVRWQRIVGGNDVTLSHDSNPSLEEWKLIISGIAEAVKTARSRGATRTKVLFEGKGAGDPCYLCVCTDTNLEIAAIKELNEKIGSDVVRWQGEFCHTRGTGQTFASAMEQVIAAGVFGGQIHFNSGGLASKPFTEMLKGKGSPMSRFQQYVDNDFLPGQGPEEWLEDQARSIEVGARWSAETGNPFEVEFDARFCRYSDTIGALRNSAQWVIGQFAEARKKLAIESWNGDVE